MNLPNELLVELLQLQASKRSETQHIYNSDLGPFVAHDNELVLETCTKLFGELYSVYIYDTKNTRSRDVLEGGDVVNNMDMLTFGAARMFGNFIRITRA